MDLLEAPEESRGSLALLRRLAGRGSRLSGMVLGLDDTKHCEHGQGRYLEGGSVCLIRRATNSWLPFYI